MPRTTVPAEYTRGYRRNPEFNPPETIPTDRFKPPQSIATSNDEVPIDDPAVDHPERDGTERSDD